MKRLIKLLVPIALLMLLLGCGKDDNNNPTLPTDNTFRVVATVNAIDSTANPVSGSVTFTVTNRATVTGVFHVVEPAEATHNLTGTFMDTVNVLMASGSGYNFSGILNDTTGYLEGVITGGASGVVVGSLDEGNDNSSVAYCGTFSGSDSGTWNFMIEGNSLYGSHTSMSGGGVLTGTVSGNIITLYEDGAQVGAGTRSGDNVSGTWHSAQGPDAGTWTGSRCN